MFSDQFVITDVDPEKDGGKRFTRVSRFFARSENHKMDMICDFNNELYPLKKDQKIDVLLASTLKLDGSQDEKHYLPSDEPSLMDNYEYVMHGKVFKVLPPKNPNDKNVEILISYGGLLMSLKGGAQHLQKIDLDMQIYLLIRKAGSIGKNK